MHTIEFTCDSCNFWKKLLYPIICIFNFTLYVFYDFLHILISYWVHFYISYFISCSMFVSISQLSSQTPYSSAPLIYVMKWVNMTYVLSDHVCFWQFAYLVTINFQEFNIIYFIILLFANSLELTYWCGTDRCFCYDIM